jgi:hypothetical protein
LRVRGPAGSLKVGSGVCPNFGYRNARAAIRFLVDALGFESPLGTRGFGVSDPEGMYWSFGTLLPRLIRDERGRLRPHAGPRRSEP